MGWTMAIDRTLNYPEIWNAVAELRAHFHTGNAWMDNSGRHTKTDEVEDESSTTESQEDED